MDELIKLLHEIDGHLGLAVHRREGDTDEWIGRAANLISRIRRIIPTLEPRMPVTEGYERLGWMDRVTLTVTRDEQESVWPPNLEVFYRKSS